MFFVCLSVCMHKISKKIPVGNFDETRHYAWQILLIAKSDEVSPTPVNESGSSIPWSSGVQTPAKILP